MYVLVEFTDSAINKLAGMKSLAISGCAEKVEHLKAWPTERAKYTR